MAPKSTAQPSTFGGCCSCNKERIDEKKCTAKPRRKCGHVVACCQSCAEERMSEDFSEGETPGDSSIARLDAFFVYKVTPERVVDA
jgi:hypothetical protein